MRRIESVTRSVSLLFDEATTDKSGRSNVVSRGHYRAVAGATGHGYGPERFGGRDRNRSGVRGGSGRWCGAIGRVVDRGSGRRIRDRNRLRRSIDASLG